jgi:hypothetical protein
MGGTKGSHLVVDNKELFEALGDRMIYYEHSDGRVCITFRFMDKVIVGSTDIRVEHPDEAICEEDEVDYMLGALKGVFPKLEIARDEIVYRVLRRSSAAGVRAGLHQPGFALASGRGDRAGRRPRVCDLQPDRGQADHLPDPGGGGRRPWSCRS